MRWTVCRWKSMHAFVTDIKHKTPARCSAVLCSQEGGTWITQAVKFTLNVPAEGEIVVVWLEESGCKSLLEDPLLFSLPFPVSLPHLWTPAEDSLKERLFWVEEQLWPEGIQTTQSAPRLSQKWEERCGSAVIWLQKLADAKAYWIFKYHSHSGNSADLRDSPLNTTFTSHSLEFMQNIG